MRRAGKPARLNHTAKDESVTDLETTDTTKRQLGIQTTMLPATDTLGQRINAKWADAHNLPRPLSEITAVSVHWNDALDTGDNHFSVAYRLLAQSSRAEHWQITGRIDNTERGYLFVLSIRPEVQ